MEVSSIDEVMMVDSNDQSPTTPVSGVQPDKSFRDTLVGQKDTNALNAWDDVGFVSNDDEVEEEDP